jgi:hypothetical protein
VRAYGVVEMITAALATIALMSAPADKWEIKPNLTKDNKISYRMSIDALVNSSEEHHALFTQTTTFHERAEEDTKSSMIWDNLEVDGQSGMNAPTMYFKVNGRGLVTGVMDMEDPFRRMITPLYFAYPDTAIGEGDKWEAKTGPDGNYKLAFEVKGTETITGEETLKIEEKIKESNGTYGDGTWWVNKSGVPVKFELKLKEWVVPFAGPEAVEATIKGTKS